MMTVSELVRWMFLLIGLSSSEMAPLKTIPFHIQNKTDDTLFINSSTT
jgi:hypothetical protein